MEMEWLGYGTAFEGSRDFSFGLVTEGLVNDHKICLR